MHLTDPIWMTRFFPAFSDVQEYNREKLNRGMLVGAYMTLPWVGLSKGPALLQKTGQLLAVHWPAASVVGAVETTADVAKAAKIKADLKAIELVAGTETRYRIFRESVALLSFLSQKNQGPPITLDPRTEAMAEWYKFTAEGLKRLVGIVRVLETD